MTRSGDDYMRALRDGRTVLVNGERVADVTAHPAFAGGDPHGGAAVRSGRRSGQS